MLRTVFAWKKLDKPVQIVLKKVNLQLTEYDLSSFDQFHKEQMLNELKEEDRNQPFDLEAGPLFRVMLCKLDHEHHNMIISNHHIIYDGWSNGIILKEFFEMYSTLNQDQLPVNISKPSFKEYLKWFTKQDQNFHQKYWQEYLRGFDQKTTLPLVQEKFIDEITDKSPHTYTYKISKTFAEQIQDIIKTQGITISTLFNAVWGILLQRYNNSDDVLFGTTVSGRPADISGVEEIVGLFINTIPLRVNGIEDETVTDLLHRINDMTQIRQKYETTPLFEIQQISEISSNSSLFDSIVVVENYPLDEMINNGNYGLTIDSASIFEKTNYNLALEFTFVDGIDLNFIYNHKFSEEAIAKVSKHFENILTNITHACIDSPQKRVSEIEMILEEEKELLLEYNLTDSDYPKNKPLHQLFEEVVSRRPDQIALQFDEGFMTYQELNQKANQLAGLLRNKGVQRESIVGLFINRSFEMMIGILGILKAGGAYLPLNPDDPKERIGYILEDSKSKFLVTRKSLIDQIDFSGEVVCVDDSKVYSAELDKSVPKNINTSTDLAYVIYTSGTTGKPKGNLTTHHNISRVVKNTNYIEITDQDRILQLSNYAFDGSTFDIFGALLNGATLVLIKKRDLLNLERLAEVIETKKITVFFITTALFNMLVDHKVEALKNVRKILFGGEKVSYQHVKKAFNALGPAHLIHVYGPTESTVFATYYPVNQLSDNAKTIPIGKPISNTQIYILDKNQNLQPAGAQGEICISGDGLARGYLNHQDLTEEKFVLNRFTPGEKLYKTGDLAQWLDDGNIEFIGRIDQQIKLRGFRIELNEIAAQLVKHDLIKEAVVTLINEEENKYLCGYLVVKSDGLTVSEIRAFLKNELPEYMIPAYFVYLKSIPLTQNGKVDFNALPKPTAEINLEVEYVAPINDTQAKLVSIFKEVLKVERVGIKNDFFTLGGHSLKATSLVSKIMKEFDVDIPLREVFECPTVEELAKIIEFGNQSQLISIEKVEERELYPVSSAQKRMHILNELKKDNISYNMPGAWVMEGNLDIERFETVFKSLIKRHEAFRTSFEMVDGEPQQRVHKDVDFKIEFIKEEKDLEQAGHSYIEEFVYPFDLKKAPLFRVRLIEFADKYLFVYDMHHIISDGISMRNLINDFTALYNGSELSVLRIQYKDVAIWQNNFFKSETLKIQESYWLDLFAYEQLPALNFPTDYPRLIKRSYAGDSVHFNIEKDLTDQLKGLAIQNGATPYMLLLALYNLLLYKYTRQEDIIIGTPVAGRSHPDLENIIGMFVNTLAVRNNPTSDKALVEFLTEVKENSLKAFENQDYPFEKLIEKLDLNIDQSRNPLFDTFFVLQDGDQFDFELSDVKLTPYPFINKIAKFDFTMEIFEKNGELHGILEYSTDLFKKDTMERFGRHFTNLLKNFVKRPDQKIAEIEILSEDEKQQLIYNFNDTLTVYPKDQTLHEMLEDQVAKRPDQIALQYKDQQLTYQEFNQKVNQLARLLREKGVTRDSIVGLMVERSLERIIGIYAILKAGGAYLPIDPELPVNRVKFMLEDSKASIFVTQNSLADKVVFDGEMILIDEADIFRGDCSNLEIINTQDDLAYVIYTSGTTGKPKGNLTTHFNVYGVVKNPGYVTITENDRILQVLNYAFDASVIDIFGSLVNGATLILVSKEYLLDITLLGELIEKEKITIVSVSTAMFNILVDQRIDSLKDVRKVLFGGEKASLKHIQKAFEYLGPARLLNMYGPTECTVLATYYQINSLSLCNQIKSVPIGTPISNAQIYILDQDDNHTPIGVAGELCISGDGLGRGYLNRPELTEKKFVQNPIRILPYSDGERLYRTGDLARWLPDGNIEFIGRIDHQVKIRGFRIELGEIEIELRKCGEIQDAVVIAREDLEGNKYLCSYLVADNELSAVDLRDQLAKSLPDYMIPSYFIQLESLPLTSNGKVDQKALPEPSKNINTGLNYVAPTTEIEERLAKIWSEVLGVQQVGIYDNFFVLGGHSLKASALLSKTTKEFNVEIPLSEIFTHPTIKEFAQLIQNAKKYTFASIESIEERANYPVSSAQKRMFILNQLYPNSSNYNMPAALMIEGSLDVKYFEEVLRELVKRHEAFRTSFELLNGEVVQKIHHNIYFKVTYQETNQDELEKIIAEFIQPFNLSTAPLFRAGLIKFNQKHLFIFDMHHIIADGVSMGILIRDVQELYANRELPKLTIQYKDFTIWQNKYLKSHELKQQEEYWLELFKEFSDKQLPDLNFPTDYPKTSLRSNQGDIVHFMIEKEMLDKLKLVAAKHGSTLYMLFLAAYNLLLYKYTSKDDLIVGTPVAGRTHPDLDNVIGMFVNTLAMRNQLSSEQSFTKFLNGVKVSSLKAFENQDYPFEMLIEKLDLESISGQNPLFDTFFSLQNGEGLELKIPDLTLSPYHLPRNVAKFDLSLDGFEQDGEIEFTIEYSTEIFKKETIKRIARHFLNLLDEVIEFPEKKIADFKMISEDERKQLVIDFNQTKFEYPDDKLLHQLFEEQVERGPDKIALIFKDEQLTYLELNQRANQLARVLLQKGAKQNQVIGIMVKPSIERMIGILAILKAGAGYLPIDPTYPASRVEYMLEDSESEILLTLSNQPKQFSFKGEIIYIEDDSIDSDEVQEDIKANLKICYHPNDLAYVIYTSGSTGKPKGVQIEHRNVVGYINAFNHQFKLTTDDVVLHQASYAFDASIEEIYPILAVGGTLVIFEKDEYMDVKLLTEVIRKNQINLVSCSPLLLNELNQSTPLFSVRTFISGGDVLKPEYITNLIKYADIYNTYGPTEATVCATYYKCTEPVVKNIPIGKPIANYQVYILDRDENPVPIGVEGELCISGVGVTRGYINRANETKEKFIPNRFREETSLAESVIYKTGDLARCLADGNIEFRGRIDQQIKIRGFRIEPGEIEEKLVGYPEIKDAIVIERKDQSDNSYLCGYVVSENEFNLAELRKYLNEELPHYMIPAKFVILEDIPLTVIGKIDRKRLPEPDGDTGIEYVAPANKIEKRLAEIWSEILGTQKIGRDDDFFALGGHSLKATTLVSRIYKEFDVEVSLGKVFNISTLKELAEYIDVADKKVYSSIESVEEREYYPASSAQKRLFILDQFEGIETTYNMPGMFLIKGDLDKERFQKAVQELVKRHESLRTSFESINGEVVQRVYQDVDVSIDYIAVVEDEIEKIATEFVQPFDLSKVPLFRVGLLNATIDSSDQFLLIFDMHHIISDAVSMNILINDFVRFYQGLELLPLKIQYKDFAVWQNDLFASEEIKNQEEYWLDIFKDDADDNVLPVLNMPTDHPRPTVMSFAGDHLYAEIEKELTTELKKLIARENVTLFIALMAVYNILLSKYSSQDDIIVGTPIAGRDYPDLDQILGMFVNTLAVRNYPKAEKTFNQFLLEVKAGMVKAYENQDYPFEMLIDKLELQRDLSRNPLFDTVFALQNADEDELMISDLSFAPYQITNKVSRFDLTWNLTENDGRIEIGVEYSTKLYQKETVERLVGHFRNIISEIVRSPEIKIAEIKMISEEEKNYLLYHVNDTRAEYPEEKTVKQLFEEQVEVAAERIAVVCKDQVMSYLELNERANQLARGLRDRGAGPDQIIGIMVNRSIEMIVGMLAIVKAGGAYLPIDPDYPSERIEYMLKDSQTKLLLTDQREEVLFDGEVIDLLDDRNYHDDGSNLTDINSPNDLLYIIYTSGSTGKPKGVMIEQRNLVRLMFNDKKQFDFTQSDVWTMFHSYCFDFSVWEMYGALLYGGKLVIIPKLIAQNPAEFLEILRKEEVTILNQTPTAFYKLSEEEMKGTDHQLKVRYIIYGGEALKPLKLKEWNQVYPKTRLINMYGITETTVHVTFKEITNEEINSNVSNIGRPIPTLTTYIMDQNLQLLPIGVPGELCVGGAGLARGYLNRAELTKEKFIDHPYLDEERLYRSGDLARLLPDGEMEYLGRIDHQVKIRGFRIELGEIEKELLEHAAIREGVVLAKKDAEGQSYLVAYIVTETELAIVELRKYLAKTLPAYMIPSYFIRLDQLPLTSNGKLNRKALPEVDGYIQTGREYIAPQNEVEEKLVQIWSEILGVERIGVEDDFFELGGHSLEGDGAGFPKDQKEFNVEISLKDIFKAPTLKEIAETILRSKESIYTSLEPVESREFYPVSAAQKRLFLFNEIQGENTTYNIPDALIIEGEFDRELFNTAIQELIRRHEAFRTSFTTIEKEVVQIIHSEVEFDIVDLEIKEERLEEGILDFVKPFDLKKAPLLRVGLAKLKQRYLVLFDMHHIISDGTSMNILIHDFLKLYAKEELPKMRVQYKEFAIWQDQFFASDLLKKQEEYWLQAFNDGVPVLNLPTDYERPHILSTEGDAIQFEVSKELTDRLNELAYQTGSTLFMVLLTALNALLSKYTGQEEIVIGTPIAGRTHPDLENIIGMFVNTLALKNNPASDKSFTEFLCEVKENILKAYENQDYQFEMLVEKLGLQLSQNRTPLFDVVLLLQNMGLKEIKTEKFKAIPYSLATKTAKFDISLYVEENDGLKVNLNYRSKLFKRETIERFAERFVELIEEIVENPERLIGEIGLQSEEEVAAAFSDFMDDLEDEF